MARIRRDGSIVIEIPASAVIHNLHFLECHDTDEPLWRVTDEKGFVRDFVSALNEESETGQTLVHEMLDSAIRKAVEDGSQHLEEAERTEEDDA